MVIHKKLRKQRLKKLFQFYFVIACNQNKNFNSRVNTKMKFEKNYRYKTFDHFNHRNAGIIYYLPHIYLLFLHVTVVKQKCGTLKSTYSWFDQKATNDPQRRYCFFLLVCFWQFWNSCQIFWKLSWINKKRFSENYYILYTRST